MLQRPLASSKTSAPDSESPRRISPTKNGLPSVSVGDLPGQLERRPASSSWPATAVMISRHLVGAEAVQGDALHTLRASAGRPAPR